MAKTMTVHSRATISVALIARKEPTPAGKSNGPVLPARMDKKFITMLLK